MICLRSIMNAILKWSNMHSADFTPRKYNLVLLVKQRSTPTTPPLLRKYTLHRVLFVHILGLSIDSKLSGHSHVVTI